MPSILGVTSTSRSPRTSDQNSTAHTFAEPQLLTHAGDDVEVALILSEGGTRPRSEMTTYTLVIEQAGSGKREAKAYSTAANALDDLECWRDGGAMVPLILRNGRPITEAALHIDEAVGKIDVE